MKSSTNLVLLGSLSFGLAFSAGLPAQTSYVVPATSTSVEGASFTSFPFGRSTAVRVQHGYGAALFTAQPIRVRKIAFRPDGSRALSAKGVDIEVALGSIPKIGVLDTVFAKNRGLDFTTVFSRRRISLPAIASAAGPRAFAVELVLDKVFAFDPRNAGLLVEILVHGQQSGRYELDLDSSCTSARADFGLPGCPGSNQLVPRADCPTLALSPGKAFTLRVARLRANDLALGFLGTRESGIWQGLSLPAALDLYGAPGCALNTDIAVSVGSVVNALGELRLPGVVPNLPGLIGVWIRFQATALDAKANSLGLSFSNAHKVQICATPPMSRVVATRVDATLGTLELGLVPVTRLQD